MGKVRSTNSFEILRELRRDLAAIRAESPGFPLNQFRVDRADLLGRDDSYRMGLTEMAGRHYVYEYNDQVSLSIDGFSEGIELRELPEFLLTFTSARPGQNVRIDRLVTTADISPEYEPWLEVIQQDLAAKLEELRGSIVREFLQERVSAWKIMLPDESNQLPSVVELVDSAVSSAGACYLRLQNKDDFLRALSPVWAGTMEQVNARHGETLKKLAQ